MKNGTLYAGRLRKAFSKARQAAAKPALPERDDPIRRLTIAILGVGCSDKEASRAIDRALATMVDWNEIRVSSAYELNQATGNIIPQGVQRCQKLITALQSVFDRENRLSLDRLLNLPRREAKRYLEQLDGMDEYVVASVILWSLGGHAIPINDRLLAALRSAELVHPQATRGEVQAFLERHISATQAREFCLVMQSFKASTKGRSRRAKTKPRTKKKVSAR